MDSIKLIPKTQHRKNNSFVFKYCNLSFNEPKVVKVKNYKVDYETISLKSKNTQSISTGIDDRKDNLIKKSQSQKVIKISNILNRLSKRKNVNGIELVLKGRRKGSTPEKNANEVININQNNSKYKFTENKNEKDKKINSKNTINILGKNKNINPKINNNITGKIYKEDNSLGKENKQINKAILKAAPPKLNNLFSNSYDFSNNGIGKKNMVKSSVPNVFFNHLMINSIKYINNKSQYLLLSTTNRIKAKKLIILYHCPLKETL